MLNSQHIVKAFFRKTGTTVLVFYEIKSRKYSGHFILNPIDKSKMLTTIEKSFPPDFESIPKYAVQLNGKVDFLYMKPDEPEFKYSFFNQLQTLINENAK